MISCRTKHGSYDENTRTIIVYVPRQPDPARDRQELVIEEIKTLGVPEEEAQAYVAMGATGVREMVDQAVELLGKYEQIEDLMALGLTEDNAKAYIEWGPSALREYVAPVIERLKSQEQYEEMVAIGLSGKDANHWIDLGADEVQILYKQTIEKLEHDKVEITPDI